MAASQSIRVGQEASLFAATPARPDSVTDYVFELIRTAIIDKSLAPGSTIREGELAAQLSVSKTPVRESMIRLREMGLVEPAGRLLRVIVPSRSSIQEVYEYRQSVEPQAARLAALRAVPAAKDLISQSARRAVTSADAHSEQNYLEAGHDFHIQVAEASGNSYLARAVERSHIYTLTLTRRDLSEVVDQRRRAKQHVAIAKAIHDGDGDRAAQEMERHITGMMDSALARFDE